MKEKPVLAMSQVQLRSYSIPVVQSVEVNIVYKQQSAKLQLLMVQGDGPSLLGQNWLSQLKLDWQEIHHLSTTPLQTLLDKYDSVFQEGLYCKNKIVVSAICLVTTIVRLSFLR